MRLLNTFGSADKHRSVQLQGATELQIAAQLVENTIIRETPLEFCKLTSSWDRFPLSLLFKDFGPRVWSPCDSLRQSSERYRKAARRSESKSRGSLDIIAGDREVGVYGRITGIPRKLGRPL